MTKQVMVKAWEIARGGANKFGGNVKEYFAAALKMAWEIVKNVEEEVKVFVSSIESGKRGLWVAKITGTCKQYNLKREFLQHDAVDGNWLDFYLADGLYTGKYSNAAAGYFVVKNGEATNVTQPQAIEIAEQM